MSKKKPQKPDGIRDRVRELRRVRACDIAANPLNWRTHPQAQRGAFRGLLKEVGFAGAVLCRETDDGNLMLIDGHLRQEEMGEQEIPVLVLDVTEDEANKLLVSIDPLAALAEASADKLRGLLEAVQTEEQDLADMLTALAEESGMFSVGEADAPDLADGDREPFRQMTFTVHDSQFETIEAAIKIAKDRGGGVSDVNENGNGNALAWICKGLVDG